MAAVAAEGLPAVAMAIFDGVVGIAVEVVPGDEPRAVAIDVAAQACGVRVVGQHQVGQPYPAASRGAAGADGKAVADGSGGRELHVVLLDLFVGTARHAAHLHEGVHVGGVVEGAEVEEDIVGVLGGEAGIDPLAL